MALNQAFLSAGTSIRYCVETTAGTRPTTGYTIIPNVKSISGFDEEPAMQQTTDLSEKDSHTYIRGLKDKSDSVSLSMNLNQNLITSWDNLYKAYEDANAAGKGMWFAIVFPEGFTDAYYFRGEPVALGFGDVDVDSPLECEAKVVPQQIVGWAAKPTGA